MSTGAVSATATISGSVGATVTTILQTPTATPHSNVFSGDYDPTHYNPENPLMLVTIQLVIIIGLSRILHLGLSRLRQPRVLSEIAAGVLLGPTAFGRIPGFTRHTFPPQSIQFLNLLSTLGLVLFLALIGCEVDLALFKRNLKPSLSVALAGIVVPFGLGWAIAKALYERFVSEDISFTAFGLFIGTASSITAFPVLARILTELELIQDPVGIVVIASGVVNDVIGWVLLSLSIALSAASSEGQVAAYIFLTAIGFTLVLFFVIRPAYKWLGRKTDSFDGTGPSPAYMTACLLLVLVTAFAFECIGISAIFGGFVVGLCLPSNGNVATFFIERLEDIVVSLFIPLYFSTSGLRTDLTLLNTGEIWGFTFMIIAVAFSGKFVGCLFAAKLCNFTWRESGAVGSLMSAKGLIELIVLNIGLQAGIIPTRVFSMYVLEALVLTFAATPLTLAFYPKRLRRGNNDITMGRERSKEDYGADHSSNSDHKTNFTVVLHRADNLAPLLVFSRLVSAPPHFDGPAPEAQEETLTSETSLTTKEHPPSIGESIAFNTLRLEQLDDRTSKIMQGSADLDHVLARDALQSLFSTFLSLNGISVARQTLKIVAPSLFAEAIAESARRTNADMVVVPWALSVPSEDSLVASYVPNPLESLFGTATSLDNSSTSSTAYIRDLFAFAHCDVGIMLSRGGTLVPTNTRPGWHLILLPFHGGSDDRACLNFALQLATTNRGISVHVFVIEKTAAEEDSAASSTEPQVNKDEIRGENDKVPLSPIEFTVQSVGSNNGGTRGRLHRGDTLYATQHALESETADEVALTQAKARALTSFKFVDVRSSTPLRASIERARAVVQSTDRRVTWLVGRSRRDAASHRSETLELLREAQRAKSLGMCANVEVRRCIGEPAVAAVLSELGSNVLVVQAAATGGVRWTDAKSRALDA
ncbi:K(+)/H(+) antiporter [Microbotryomycetes sp. JL221]|nr:K(+)/H(+) antiporter [Microbotryomycetes sp. JL221]